MLTPVHPQSPRELTTREFVSAETSPTALPRISTDLREDRLLAREIAPDVLGVPARVRGLAPATG
jgi:hypothetical protein